MNQRQVPGGFRDVQVWTVDSYTGAASFKWYSFSNDNHGDDEVLPWDNGDNE